MKTMDSQEISLFRSGLRRMKMESRRLYAAELCNAYFKGSARKMERVLGSCRHMTTLGMHELRTGITCVSMCTTRGRKKKKI